MSETPATLLYWFGGMTGPPSRRGRVGLSMGKTKTKETRGRGRDRRERKETG